MRDDLHRTVAVHARWKRVIKRCIHDAERATELQSAFEDAVRGELRTGMRQEWLTQFIEAVEPSRPDLFASDGRALERCGALATLPLEREAFEVARVLTRLGRASVLELGVTLAQRVVERNIEHVVAKAREQQENSARELRQVLEAAATNLRLTTLFDQSGVAGATRTRRSSIDLNEFVE